MYCKLYPEAKNGKPSKLFTDLMSRYKERGFAKAQYIMFTSDDFLSRQKDNLIFDQNGEPTLESIIPFINVTNESGQQAMASEYERQLNMKEYGNIVDKLKEIVEFNKNNDNYIARMAENGVDIIVDVFNNEERSKKDDIEKAVKIHDEISKTLNKFGVSMHIVDAGILHGENALMDPQAAKKLGNGVRGVISLANNYKGFSALSEEVSHMLVEMWYDNPVIARAEAMLKSNPELVKDILGDEYQDVVDYYNKNGRGFLVEREALGRVIAQIINNDILSENPLFNRSAKTIENFIKQTFKIRDKATMEQFNSLIRELSQTSQQFMNQETIDQETWERFRRFGNKMANTAASLDEFDKKIEKIQELANFNIMNYLDHFEKGDFGTKKYKAISNQITELNLNLSQIKTINGINKFAMSTIDILKDNSKAIEKLASTRNMTIFDLRDFVHELLALKNLIETYRPILKDMRSLVKEIDEELKKPNRSQFIQSLIASAGDATQLSSLMNTLKTNINSLVGLLDETEDEFVRLNKKCLMMFATPYFNDGKGDLHIPNSDRVISLENVLDFSEGDINGLNRMVLSAANTDDQFIQLIDHIIQNSHEAIRAQTTTIDHKIQVLDKEFYNATKSRDTKFIFERDDEGKITGNYVSEYRMFEWQRKRNEVLKQIDEGADPAIIVAFDRANSKSVKVPYTYQYYDGRVQRTITKTRDVLLPNDSYKNPNFQVGWSEAQKKYYEGFMNIKKDLDFMLPSKYYHPYRAIQMQVASTGEAILNSDNGIMGGIKNAASAFYANYLSITDLDDGTYSGSGSIMEEIKVPSFIKNAYQNLKKASTGENNPRGVLLKYDKTPYMEPPVYFINELKDATKLSLDATQTLREFNIMACHYSGMHKIMDFMELFKEQNKVRVIYNSNYGRRLQQRLKKTLNGFEVETLIDSTLPTESTNIFKRVNELIDMQVYGKAKNQGKLIIGDLTTGKLADDLIKLTSFSMLGYNPFSGINNVVAAKYQMWIEAFGGEYFSLKDWQQAEKNDLIKNLPEMLAELHTPYTTSKLGLLGEMFNVGQNWKEKIKSSDAYKNNFARFMSNFGSSFMLESGEFCIQMTTALAFLRNYKLYKGKITRNEKGEITNESVSLLDAIQKEDITNADGTVVDAKLSLKPEYANYVKADGTKFNFKKGSKDIKQISLLIGKINQDMHGIYNHEDAPVILRYGVGRMLMLFRKHMVPQIQKRYKSLGKYHPIYNYRSGQFEEGYIVTLLRFVGDMIKPLDPQLATGKDQAKFAILYNNLSKRQKANMRRALAEVIGLTAIFILAAIVMAGWDDDDDWLRRQAYYFTKRAQLEAEMAYSAQSFMDILVSPSATISEMQRIQKVFANIGTSDQTLKSGPYKGHSPLYAAIMRCLPIYPGLYDFINIDEDNRRFGIFKQTPRPLENIINSDGE